MTSGLCQKLGKCVMPGARKNPGPEDPALNSLQRGVERGNFYQPVSGVGCQVSATEIDPLDESRT